MLLSLKNTSNASFINTSYFEVQLTWKDIGHKEEKNLSAYGVFYLWLKIDCTSQEPSQQQATKVKYTHSWIGLDRMDNHVM